MATIRASEFAYGRLQSPDLDRAEAFLTEFGMVRAAWTKTALYMRSTDPAHHIHVTELGERRFLSFAFVVSDPDDLRRIATLPGRLRDRVDRRAGRRPAGPAHRPGRAMCRGGVQHRGGAGFAGGAPGLKFRRQPPAQWRAPAAAARRIPDQAHRRWRADDDRLPRLVAWYRDTLGFLVSDEVHAGTPGKLVGSFNRLDRGETFVDHHAFFCIQGKKNGLNHLSFEIQDIDEVTIGHNHLKARGYAHVWGGRHQIGSHIFDYWQDPWRRVHKHWTDTETLNAHAPPGLCATDDLDGPWGDPIPRSFLDHASV